MSNMVSSKLFIRGISYQTDEQSLKEAFAKYGEVIDARIISDRETGRSRGFGFITFTSSDEASSGFETASTRGGFGNNTNLGVAGGVAGADDFVGGADNSFGSDGAQLGENKGGFSLDDPLKGNDRDDDDDDAGNFLKRA
ncbi:unnamed protein product [Prunus brigantina]